MPREDKGKELYEQITEQVRRRVREAVLEILHANSGGMKMTALVAELVARFHSDTDMDISDLITSGCLDVILEHSACIKVHEYDWDMESSNGTGRIRSKQFVCTKF
tara:strand:- start:3567 stop:3884 length:318 start_codon:yes stop_codon:yes gene_type:complete